MAAEDVAQDLALAPLFALGLSLPDTCALTETRLLQMLPAVIANAIDSQGLRGVERLSPTRIRYQGTAFELRVREDAVDASVLRVSIGEGGAHWTTDDLLLREARITGYGQYAVIVVSIDPRLDPVAETVIAGVRSFYESAYRRLAAQVLGELLTVEHRMTTQLYVELRSVLDEALASCVGLYGLLDDGRAMYFLDPLAIQATLARLTKSRPSTGSSPLELSATIVKGWVQTEETVAKTALLEDKPLNFQLQDLEYGTRGFDLAERGLYGQTNLICQPLVREGRVRLIAAYPRDARDPVETSLVGLCPQFTEILAAHAHSTARLMGSWRSSTDNHRGARLAEFLGRFAGGFVDSLD